MQANIDSGPSAFDPSTLPTASLSDWRSHRARALACTQRLSDGEWERALMALSRHTHPRVGQLRGTREFVEAVLWVVDSDSAWVELLSIGHSSHAVYIRFIRWAMDGLWDAVLEALAGQPGLQGKLRQKVLHYLRMQERRWERRRQKDLTTDAAVRSRS